LFALSCAYLLSVIAQIFLLKNFTKKKRPNNFGRLLIFNFYVFITFDEINIGHVLSDFPAHGENQTGRNQYSSWYLLYNISSILGNP